MAEEKAPWFAMSALFRQDTEIELLGERFGADGPFLIVGLFCEAMLQSRSGRVEGSLRTLAHDCFIDSRERAAEILSAAGETDVIEIETLDERAFVVRLNNWSRWQERFRKARKRAEGDGPDSPPPDASGHEGKRPAAPVARTGTATDTGTATTFEQSLATVDSSLHPYLANLNRVVEGKERARPLNIAAAVKACGDFADRDLATEADKFGHYFLDGAGQNRKLKDVAGTWRNWLRNAPSAKTARRQPEHPADRRIRELHEASQAGERVA